MISAIYACAKAHPTLFLRALAALFFSYSKFLIGSSFWFRNFLVPVYRGSSLLSPASKFQPVKILYVVSFSFTSHNYHCLPIPNFGAGSKKHVPLPFKQNDTFAPLFRFFIRTYNRRILRGKILNG